MMMLARRQYLSVDLLRNSEIFDLKSGRYGYMLKFCDQESPCPPVVLLYAKMSLHRYNFVKGTKFELIGVQKYVQTTGSAAASYYITLDAIDHATATGSLQTFQNVVSEISFGRFMLSCNIARIKGEPRDGKGFLTMPDMTLPTCPPENPFQTYYLLKESELQENSWIRLYLELAVAKTDRHCKAKGAGLSNLEIVDVAIDAANNEEGLYANNALFYIRYRDLYKANLGEPLDRIAIVRRSFDKPTGCFCLVGQSLSSDVIPNNRMIANEEDTGCSSFMGQIQSPQNFLLNSLHL
ncbi:PREDICTED: UPF0725 protein At3g25080 isoform X2 [Camelina sativa]|uniref:UPF0725 protein At3g25080 isoform X2 n=1 Tax=Camelina sativa TaxID=90675 RepID=A0ABM0VD52_CAMSA|nr:PREDICTED: UPF0725 protein At3g25080 isoform X2 [Camelina sativa]